MKNLCAFILLSGLLLVSCTKPWYCGEVSGLESSSLVIYPFHTATNEYIYSDISSRSIFDRDSLQVINEDGRVFSLVSFLLEQDPRNRLKRFYAIRVAPAFIIPQDNDAYTTEKRRSIYLKYNYNTSDTLTLVFKAYKNKCGNGIYEYLKIYHHNKLIHSVEDDSYADFTLNH